MPVLQRLAQTPRIRTDGPPYRTGNTAHQTPPWCIWTNELAGRNCRHEWHILPPELLEERRLVDRHSRHAGGVGASSQGLGRASKRLRRTRLSSRAGNRSPGRMEVGALWLQSREKSHKRLDWGLAPKWRGEPQHRHIHCYQQYECRNRTVLPLTSHRRSASQFSSW